PCDSLGRTPSAHPVTYGIKPDKGAKMPNTEAIRPMLGERWEVSNDNTVYTFKLKSGVKFQSGNPVDADSVVYSLDRVAKSSSGSFLYGMAAIKTVTAKDDSTVEIALTNANHNFLQILAMYTFSIVDKKTVEAQGADYLKTHSAGSGPFTLEKWDPATEAVFTPHDDYWQGSPKLGKVTIKFTKEASNRVLLLNKGDVDMAIEIQPKDVDTLESNSHLTVASNSMNQILYFAINNKMKHSNTKK
ncbi:peptide ABC transporter substrate-binding protein, partial [Paenibacillus riograndensis]